MDFNSKPWVEDPPTLVYKPTINLHIPHLSKNHIATITPLVISHTGQKDQTATKEFDATAVPNL